MNQNTELIRFTYSRQQIKNYIKTIQIESCYEELATELDMLFIVVSLKVGNEYVVDRNDLADIVYNMQYCMLEAVTISSELAVLYELICHVSSNMSYN